MRLAFIAIFAALVLLGIAFVLRRMRRQLALPEQNRSLSLVETMWVGRGQRLLLVAVGNERVLLSATGSGLQTLAVLGSGRDVTGVVGNHEQPAASNLPTVQVAQSPASGNGPSAVSAIAPAKPNFSAMVREEVEQARPDAQARIQRILQRLNTL